MSEIISMIPSMTAVAVATWGIYVLSKQQKYKRLQNLSQIFQRFADKKEFIDIFNLFDQSIVLDREKRLVSYKQEFLDLLSETPAQDKLKYLALLEDVALYAKSFEVDRDEASEPYWEYQKAFSVYCNPIKAYQH